MAYLGAACSIISLIQLAAKFCHQVEIYRQAPDMLRELMEELQEVVSVLEALRARCARTRPIEIGFVSDVDLTTVFDAPNYAGSRQLLKCTGLSRYSNRDVADGISSKIGQSSSNYHQKVLSLRKSLEEYASQSGLILVCGSMEAPLIEEALAGQSPAQKDWLCRRVAGLVLFDNGSLRHERGQTNQSRQSESSGSDGITFTDIRESNITSTKYIGLPRTTPSNFATQGIFTVWVRQRIYGHSAETQRALGQPHGTHGVEITCPAEEIADGTAWAILYLIEVSERDAHACQVTGKNVRSSESFSRPVSALQYALQNRNTTETKSIFEALQWVAFALRPLEEQELSEALGTDLACDSISNASHESVNKKQYGRSILHHCREILKIDENGLVDFYDAEMRIFVLSPDFVQMTGLHMVDAHEMIAAVCVRHLHCKSIEAILKPWVSSVHWLRTREWQCHLWSYSVAFWPDHYRIAQCSSRHLSAMLHQAIIAAVAANAEENPTDGPKSKIKMNTGLEICSKYDLYILGQTYLEMGADIDGGVSATTFPLILAVRNRSCRMITILLESGADPSQPDNCGFTAWDCAYASGDRTIINTLLQRSGDLRIGERLLRPTEQLVCHQVSAPSFPASKSMQAKVGKLSQKASSLSSPSTPANEMKSSLCPPTPLINTCLAHNTRSHTNSNSVAEAIRNLEVLSLVDAHMQCSPNCRKVQQAEQDTWLLIGFEDFGTEVT